MTALHLESLPFRKNERMFEEKSSGTAKGFVMTDLHRTRRRSIRIGRGTGRAIIRIFMATTLTWCAGTVAVAGADLYRAKVTVTGQGEANRIFGFAACLEDVLIKVSGALKLSGDPRLAAYKSKAKSFVTGFSYRDQFLGKPIRDEQGTRDRPYDLTVEFEESKIDDILKTFGLKPWLSHRPRLAVFVEMEQGPRNYIVTADGPQSDLQRDALLAAADKRGMDIVLPGTAALAKSNITGAELRTAPFPALMPVSSGDWSGMTGSSAGPHSGGWTGATGRTVGRFAASRSMKPSGAASAARPRSCQAMAIRTAACAVDRVQPSTSAAITGLANDPPYKEMRPMRCAAIFEVAYLQT